VSAAPAAKASRRSEHTGADDTDSRHHKTMSLMTVDGYKARIEHDAETDSFRGKTLYLNGGADLHGRTVTGCNIEEQAEMVMDLFLIGRNTTPLMPLNQGCGTVGNLAPIVKPSGGRVPPVG
jgi:hypothetical protein